MKIPKSHFFLVVILIACILASCQTEESDSTADWELYENQTLGYSIKYPTDCTLGSLPAYCKQSPPEERPPECLCFLNAENPNEVFLQAFLEISTGQPSLAGFTIGQYNTPVYNPPEGTDVISWLKDQFPLLPGEIPSEPNMDIDGIPTVRIYVPSSPQSPSFEEIYFIRDGKMFIIRLLDVDTAENQELYEKMLSTIQFNQ